MLNNAKILASDLYRMASRNLFLLAMYGVVVLGCLACYFIGVSNGSRSTAAAWSAGRKQWTGYVNGTLADQNSKVNDAVADQNSKVNDAVDRLSSQVGTIMDDYVAELKRERAEIIQRDLQARKYAGTMGYALAMSDEAAFSTLNSPGPLDVPVDGTVAWKKVKALDQRINTFIDVNPNDKVVGVITLSPYITTTRPRH